MNSPDPVGNDLRPVLDHAALARMPVTEGTRGEFELIEETPRRRLLFLLTDAGSVTMWGRRERGQSYLIGAYHSEAGSVAVVVDGRKGEQVALLRAETSAVDFAARLALVGEAYAWAMVVAGASSPEFFEAIAATGYPQQRTYQSQALPGGRDGQIGVQITRATQPLLVTALTDGVAGIRNPIVIRSAITRRECQSFVVRRDGTVGGAPGHQDGCVWALALAAFGLDQIRKQEETEAARASIADRPRRRNPWYDD